MFHRSIRAVAMVAAVALVASACTAAATPTPTKAPTSAPTGAASAAPTAAPTAPPVTKESLQLDFVLTAAYGALLYGKDKGYFKDASIDLDLIPGRGTDLALNEINNNRVKFAMVDLTNYIIQRAKGATQTTAIYVYNNIATTGLASLKQLGPPSDMIGKTFGTVAQSSGRTNIPLVLKQNNVNWDPATQIQLMDFSVLYPTLFEGKIDTAEVGLAGSWEGAVTRAKGQGLTLYLKLLSEWGFLDYSKVIIARDDVIRHEADLVKRFIGALSKSQKEAHATATGAQIYTLVKAIDPQANEEISGMIWDNVKKYVTKPGPVEDSVIIYKLDRLKEQGTTTTLTPAQLYNNEFIPKA
jgi:ABC-type nitrate/sulfonate/bicarbonate transport system substrate-binding protein